MNMEMPTKEGFASFRSARLQLKRGPLGRLPTCRWSRESEVRIRRLSCATVHS
jgi:hypothetical protein